MRRRRLGGEKFGGEKFGGEKFGGEEFGGEYDRLLGIVIAGLDPAIPLEKAPPCHMIGIAGSSPAMSAVGSNSSERALRN